MAICDMWPRVAPLDVIEKKIKITRALVPLEVVPTTLAYKDELSLTKPVRRSAARRTCTWTLSVINLRPS